MRDVFEMKHEEILKLTDAEIQRIYDFMCAESGIRFAEFPKEPEKQVFKPDDVVYEVNDIYTQDKDVAMELAEVITRHRNSLVKIDYNYRVGSDYQYLKKNLDTYDYSGEMKTHKVFKAGTYEALQASMGKFNEAKDKYAADKKAYDEYMKKRAYTTQKVADFINGHWKLHWKMDEYKKLMERYIELANGDKAIAMNFFKKALSDKEWGATEQWFLYKFGYLESQEKDSSTGKVTVVDTRDIEERAVGQCMGY